MTTKQAAPATPLPWDAEFIVAACNAYLQLVADRQALVAFVQRVANSTGDRPYEDAASLLSRIGEG